MFSFIISYFIRQLVDRAHFCKWLVTVCSRLYVSMQSYVTNAFKSIHVLYFNYSIDWFMFGVNQEFHCNPLLCILELPTMILIFWCQWGWIPIKTEELGLLSKSKSWLVFFICVSQTYLWLIYVTWREIFNRQSKLMRLKSDKCSFNLSMN